FSMVLVPPTPMPDYIEGSSPGSQGIVHVSGVVEQSITGTPPLSTDLAGFQVLLNGTPVPVVSVSPAEVRFQIPWETPTNYYGSSASAQLVIPGAIFAAAPGALGLVSFKPVFEGIQCLFANGLSAVCSVAAHGHFSCLLWGA